MQLAKTIVYITKCGVSTTRTGVSILSKIEIILSDAQARNLVPSVILQVKKLSIEMKVIIDRFEGEHAIVELADKRFYQYAKRAIICRCVGRQRYIHYY